MNTPPEIGTMIFADDGSCSLSVCDYYLDDVNYIDLAEGKYDKDELPDTVKLFVEGSPCDYVGNPLSLSICSERLIDCLSQNMKENFTTLEAPLYFSNGDELTGYKILLPKEIIRCLDVDKSTIMDDESIGGPCCLEPVVTLSDVPKSIPIFFVEGFPWVVFFSKKGMESLAGKGFKGLAFLPVEVS